MKWLLLLLLTLTGCHNFTNRFANVEKVCGTARAPQTHYVELYSSQGKRLERSDIVVTDEAGLHRNELLTDKGCLTVSDSSAASILIVRQRLLPEGLPLALAQVIDDTTVTQRSLNTYTYQPPTILCQNQLTTRQGTIRLFAPSDGLNPDAYQVIGAQGLGSDTLNIQAWQDGSYQLQGQIFERFSPEQRHYDFNCELTIDRTPPHFIASKFLRADGEPTAAPGEILKFPVDPRDPAVTLAVCVDKPGEACRFQDLRDGQWVAPASGVYQLQIVARDPAGNESAPLAMSVRIYDASKIAAIQSELDVIRGLVGEQKGVSARARLAALRPVFESLGTAEEKAVVQTAFEEVQYAVYLSPDQVKFSKTSPTFKYLNWIVGPKSEPLLVFQDGLTLILMNTAGAVVKPWPLLSKTIKQRACFDGIRRDLLVKDTAGIFRLTVDGMKKVLSDSAPWANIANFGDCRYRSWKNADGKTRTVADLDQLDSLTKVEASNLWFLHLPNNETLILGLDSDGYFTQAPGSNSKSRQPELNDLSVQKVLPNAGILAVDAGTQVRVLFWNKDVFEHAYQGFVKMNAAEAKGLADGGSKVLIRDSSAWFLWNAAAPELAPQFFMPTAAAPDFVQMGTSLFASAFPLVNDLLDVSLFDDQGNVLSLLRLDDLAPRSGLLDVIGDRLLLDGSDSSYHLVNPLPHTTLGHTRQMGDSMQWGGPEAHYTRQVLTDGVAWVQESLSAFGQTYKMLEQSNQYQADRLVEKPYAILGDRAVFVGQRNHLMLVTKDGCSTPWELNGLDPIQRVDFAAAGESLLLVTESGAVYEQSLLDHSRAPVRILESLWKGCDSLNNRALDFVRATETYVRVACQTVVAIDRSGVVRTLVAGPLPWILAQSSDDGRHLLLVSAQGAQVDGITIQPKLPEREGLEFGRMNAAGTHAVLVSRHHVFLLRLSDHKIWDITLPKSRPFTVDAVSFDESTQTFALLGAEGLLELPLHPEALPKE